MIIQRGKVIAMLKQMAKEEEIPVDVQLIITQRLMDNSDILRADEDELVSELCRLYPASHICACRRL